MYCEKCKVELEDGVEICPKCGTNVHNGCNQVENEEEHNMKNNDCVLEKSNENYNTNPEKNTLKDTTSKPKFKNKNVIIAVVVILLVIVLGALNLAKPGNGAGQFLNNNNDKDSGASVAKEDGKHYRGEEVEGKTYTSYVHVAYAYHEDNNIIVDILTVVQNNSHKDLQFDPSLFKLKNDGLVVDSFSDYDYQTIESGGVAAIVMHFAMPSNVNGYTEYMTLMADGEEIEIGYPNPDREDQFEGVYRYDLDKAELVIVNNGVDGEYQVFSHDLNPDGTIVPNCLHGLDPSMISDYDEITNRFIHDPENETLTDSVDRVFFKEY